MNDAKESKPKRDTTTIVRITAFTGVFVLDQTFANSRRSGSAFWIYIYIYIYNERVYIGVGAQTYVA